MDNSIRVSFHGEGAVADARVEFAVIAARYQDQWIFCRHRERTTWEIPGGHREPGETLEQTARRELCEETGATVFTLYPIGVYSVTGGSGETFGMFYRAEVSVLSPLPPSEIEEIRLGDGLPEALTYPHIQPLLWERLLQYSTSRRPEAVPPPRKGNQ